VYALPDFNDAQIEQFIRGWYAALVERKWRSPGEAEHKLGDLLRRTAPSRPAAARPEPVAAHADGDLAHQPRPAARRSGRSLQRVGRPAPLALESADRRRQGAARRAGDPLLKLSDLREVLEELAFKVHEQNVGKEGTADIGEDRLVRAFRPLLNNSKDKADVVVDYIEKRAGLLIGQGEKDGERQFTFPHRTFQELLAACHLAAQGDFPAECAALARTAAAHWQAEHPCGASALRGLRGLLRRRGWPVIGWSTRGREEGV